MLMIKSAILRAVAAVLTVFMLIGVGVNTTPAYDVRDPEACVLNFSILSDSHIEGNNIPRYNVFAKSLQNVKKNKSGNDAVVFLGDNTMNGQAIESLLFHGAVSALLKGENILPVQGNHDIGNGEGDYDALKNRWYDYTAAFFGKKLDRPYYYEVIDGCYFIVLGMEAQEVYEMLVTEEQFAWLEETLALAAESGMPCFVFSHIPVDDAVDETGAYTDRLTETLAAYNREHDLFCFVGHTHMPLYLFWSFHNSDGFPETYLPRLTELYGEDDHEIGENTGIGIEVEVYENEVLIRGRDFLRGEWRYDGADETMCEVTYPLKNPIVK